MKYLALDIGGANLKAADGNGFARSLPFPLWQKPNDLSAALQTLIDEAPPSDRIALTMTGELADCFTTKADGVRHIVDGAVAAAGIRPVEVYLTNGRLVLPAAAKAANTLAAASNWHALAHYSCRYAADLSGLLIDLGSTTADIIPLSAEKTLAIGRTDTQRLLAGELVYTGVQRTPICSVVDAIPFRGRLCPVARELFATMGDIYLVLGNVSEQPDSHNTADGRPATKTAAIDRIARMICADRDTFDSADALVAAKYVAEMQRRQLEAGLDQVLGRIGLAPKVVVLSGEGEFAVWRLLDERGLSARRVSLADQLGPVVSRCAPAHALAVIAAEASAGIPV